MSLYSRLMWILTLRLPHRWRRFRRRFKQKICLHRKWEPNAYWSGSWEECVRCNKHRNFVPSTFVPIASEEKKP